MSLYPYDSIVIVGRGIAGLSLAYRLLQRGIRPILVGKSFLEEGATRCAQGLVANKGLIFFESPLFKAKLRSLNHLKSWVGKLEKDSGLTIDHGFEGVFEPYYSPDDFNALLSRIYRRQFLGCFRARNLSANNFPFFSLTTGRALGAMFYPDDGWIDPHCIMKALEKIVEIRGAKFIDRHVHAVSLTDTKSFDIKLDDNAHLRCSKLVLAAGSGTPKILTMCNIKTPKSFLIGGQTLKIKVPSLNDRPQTAVKGTYSATIFKENLLIGSSSWKGELLSKVSLLDDTENIIADLKNKIDISIPYQALIESRMGVRFRFADRMPVVGTLNDEKFRHKLYFLTGFYKSGIQLADLCANDLVRDILGEKSSDVNEFSPERLFKNCSIHL